MRVALVGSGGWGKNHARILSQLGVLSAVCDIDRGRAMEFGKKYSAVFYTSVDDLIESDEFDAAIVATPTVTHFDVASKLIRAKKHVLVEKPITYESGQGQRLADIAHRNKVVLACGYIERFNPAVSLVKSHIDGQKHGDLIMLEFHRENAAKSGMMDVGIIHDVAVHDIDTANWIFGQMPSVVFARAGKIINEQDDYASIMLGYKSNKTAIIYASRVAPRKARTFRAICTNADIMSDFVLQQVKIDGIDVSARNMQEPLLLEVEDFLGAAKNGGSPLMEPQQAVNVTRIAEAALLSSQKGIPIYLELK